MHVETKRVALAGLLAAFAVILVSLGAVIETNTLFLIAAASFCVGIAIREWGILKGAGFWLACVLLCIMIAPNKFYGITFAAMGLYLLFSEWLWERLASAKAMKHRVTFLWLGRYFFFNCIYIPLILFFPNLLFARSLSGFWFWIALLIGEVVLFVYESVYAYFQRTIWGKFRHRFMAQ